MSDDFARGYAAGVRAAIDIVETSEALDQDLGRPARSPALLLALNNELKNAERVQALEERGEGR
jgi:hypothetical protein